MAIPIEPVDNRPIRLRFDQTNTDFSILFFKPEEFQFRVWFFCVNLLNLNPSITDTYVTIMPDMCLK